MWISINIISFVDFISEFFQFFHKDIQFCITLTFFDHIDNHLCLKIYRMLKLQQPLKHICLIRNLFITKLSIMFQILSIYTKQKLSLLCKFGKNFHLTIRIKTRQYSTGMTIIQKLSSYLQIQSPREFTYSLHNLHLLQLYILISVKSQFLKLNSVRLIDHEHCVLDKFFY